MTANHIKTVTILGVAVLLIFALVLWIFWGNTALELNKYSVKSSALPEEFSGFRIAHISDLHNAEMGKKNGKLIATIQSAHPDIIAITGDLIDSRNTDTDIALHFAEQAVKIAPCYFVTGNHEARIKEYESLINGLTDLGVTVLNDEKTELHKNGQKIWLAGVEDPSFKTDYLFGDEKEVMADKLENLTEDGGGYTVLLSHRPELFPIYVKYGVNLVLSGHAHGGQVRLPILDGLVAPNQWLFPKYDAGLFSSKDTKMIVSRGIGNSIIPVRINNRPEVILIELKKDLS